MWSFISTNCRYAHTFHHVVIAILWTPDGPEQLLSENNFIGRSPRWVFPNHDFMLHCTFFPHLLAQQEVGCAPPGEGVLVGGF